MGLWVGFARLSGEGGVLGGFGVSSEVEVKGRGGGIFR